MKSRRRFLKSIFLAALALPGLARLNAAPLAARTAPAGRFFLVNGWLLTEADLRALQDHAG